MKRLKRMLRRKAGEVAPEPAGSSVRLAREESGPSVSTGGEEACGSLTCWRKTPAPLAGPEAPSGPRWRWPRVMLRRRNPGEGGSRARWLCGFLCRKQRSQKPSPSAQQEEAAEEEEAEEEEEEDDEDDLSPEEDTRRIIQGHLQGRAELLEDRAKQLCFLRAVPRLWFLTQQQGRDTLEPHISKAALVESIAELIENLPLVPEPTDVISSSMAAVCSLRYQDLPIQLP
ncbi:uncharacterized protein LOC135983860 [Chrysemys picta bellii]|uniref:uncharacterized protein LOC135983860 n=1 Tax=Chrysemys picta bellii TaxID=8478 RepID=UPI0032B2300A